MGSVNPLSVPEIACYSRQTVGDTTIIRYLKRAPGARHWEPVTIRVRVDSADVAEGCAADRNMRRDAWRKRIAERVQLVTGD